MIIGIGIDIVEVDRLRDGEHMKEFVQRILHPEEYDYIRNSGGDAAVSAAARFAAKEAFGKALGTGIHGFRLKDVKVIHNQEGRPLIELEAGARELFDRCGGKHIHLSLSHEKSYASAVVVIEN